jgi:hypothetical protein
MSILQIKKLQSGAFEHVDSIDGTFFLGRFNFKQEFNQAFLVEAYGAKRRVYGINDIEVYNYLGTVETFTSWNDLINRLVALSYTGIDTNAIPLALTASGFGSFSNSLTTEDTIPDAGVFNYTNILGLQVKTTWANIKAKLNLLYQSILVSGTNIKTINGTSILGSGNLATDTQSYKTISGNVTIDNTYHNCIVRVTANATITIPTGLRSDWNAVFDVVGAFTATFVESGTTFSAPFGKKLLTDKMGSIYTTSANNFRLNGGFSV